MTEPTTGHRQRTDEEYETEVDRQADLLIAEADEDEEAERLLAEADEQIRRDPVASRAHMEEERLRLAAARERGLVKSAGQVDESWRLRQLARARAVADRASTRAAMAWAAARCARSFVPPRPRRMSVRCSRPFGRRVSSSRPSKTADPEPEIPGAPRAIGGAS